MAGGCLRGDGWHALLYIHAVMRTLTISEHAGVRGLMVSAIDPTAAAYYEQLGFIRAKQSEDVFMLRLKVAQDVLGARKKK